MQCGARRVTGIFLLAGEGTLLRLIFKHFVPFNTFTRGQIALGLLSSVFGSSWRLCIGAHPSRSQPRGLIHSTSTWHLLFTVFAVADPLDKALVVGFGCCTTCMRCRAGGN
jgi:hypothetical protein